MSFAICVFPIAVCPWVRLSFITDGHGKGILCPFESVALKGTRDCIDRAAPFSTLEDFRLSALNINTPY